MATQRKDTLTKPDMVAVLSRTHLARDIHGFLLPLFEAISNAMDGIENRFDAAAGEKGRIAIHFSDPNDPAKIKIRVTDNGSGLDENNYNSFKTPFSGYKLREKGRGFGRFIAFKVFRGIVYSTRYEATSTSSVRNFRFDIHEQEEFDFLDGEPAFEGTGLQVEYDQPAEEWHELVLKLVQRDVMEEIGGHFLPYFLYRWLPEITITFGDGEPEDITAYFKSRFVQLETDTFTCRIDGSTETLTYALSRIERSKRFRNHCLLFSAADRIVGSPRDLTTKLGGPFFVDGNDRKYVVIAVVRGEAFESRLNDSRTSIDISPATIEDIVSTVSDIIQAKETDQIRKIKEGQSSVLTEALRENPILRLGLRGKPINEYVAKKPNHWRAEQFISDLAVERFRASADLTRQITAAASNAEDYENKIKELVAKVDEGKKEALAEYVIHRKNIIELMESVRRYQADGRRAQEDHLHDLVFRRFSDSVKTGYFEHNLWLIDDALAFVPYVSSDRAMHGRGRKAGDKVTDLLFFDDSMILGDRDGTTISIVEFKKPMRDDYRFGDVKHDPVLQVVETLEKATEAGGIVRMDGGQVSFTGVTRRFAFIVADLRPTLVKVLKRHDFVNDWHPNIFVRYRGNESVFIQAFGYDTLIENAKKRNQAFFSVLLDE